MEAEHAFERGQRVRVNCSGVPEFATIRYALPGGEPGSWDLILIDDDDRRHEVNLAPGDEATVRPLVSDGHAVSARVLAAMWTRWMDAAATNAESSAIASMPLKPYAHQTTAVYGAMLSQPRLRLLLADEPGTGKTIMAGLYIREMQRKGLVRRAIIVCPANLATKWVDDFDRLLGGGLRQLTSTTVREDAVNSNDLWVVSLELAAVNMAVQDAIRPDKAAWDLVVFDFSSRGNSVRHVRQPAQMRLCRTPGRYCSRHTARVTEQRPGEGGGWPREHLSTSSRQRTTRTIRRASRYSKSRPPRSTHAVTAG